MCHITSFFSYRCGCPYNSHHLVVIIQQIVDFRLLRVAGSSPRDWDLLSEGPWGVAGKDLWGLQNNELSQMPLWVPVAPGKFWLVYAWMWYKEDWHLENCRRSLYLGPSMPNEEGCSVWRFKSPQSRVPKANSASQISCPKLWQRSCV